MISSCRQAAKRGRGLRHPESTRPYNDDTIMCLIIMRHGFARRGWERVCLPGAVRAIPESHAESARIAGVWLWTRLSALPAPVDAVASPLARVKDQCGGAVDAGLGVER